MKGQLSERSLNQSLSLVSKVPQELGNRLESDTSRRYTRPIGNCPADLRPEVTYAPRGLAMCQRRATPSCGLHCSVHFYTCSTVFRLRQTVDPHIREQTADP